MKAKGEAKNEEEEEKCGICLEPIEAAADLDSCEHKFCFDCIMRWVKIASVCPLCKRQVHKIKRSATVNEESSSDSDSDSSGSGSEERERKTRKRKRRHSRREVYYVRKRRMYIPDDPSMTEEEARALWFKEKLDALRRAAKFVDSYGSDENFDVKKEEKKVLAPLIVVFCYRKKEVKTTGKT